MANGTQRDAIRVNAQFTITKDRLIEVQAIKSRMIQHARGSTAAVFDVFLSQDRNHLYVSMHVENSGALESLMLEIGPDLEQLEGPAKLNKLQIFGDLTDPLKKALAQFEPEFFSDREGIDR